MADFAPGSLEEQIAWITANPNYKKPDEDIVTAAQRRLTESNAYQAQQAAQTTSNALSERLAAMENKYAADPFREQQAQLAATLQKQAAGEGPSLATGQMKQATDRNLAQILAMQASSRGVDPNVAARNIALTTAQTGQQAARDAATMRMQEQLSAQQQLAGVLGGARSQDLSATGQALQGQTGLATTGLTQALQEKLGMAQLTQQAQQAELDRQEKESESKRGFWGNILGGVINAGGGAAAKAVV